MDTEAITEDCENCAEVKGAEFKCLQKNEKEIIKITKYYDIQTNVNGTIKDGLKNLQAFIEETKKKQRQSDIAFDLLVGTIGETDENREEQNKRRERRLGNYCGE